MLGLYRGPTVEPDPKLKLNTGTILLYTTPTNEYLSPPFSILGEKNTRQRTKQGPRGSSFEDLVTYVDKTEEPRVVHITSRVDGRGT